MAIAGADGAPVALVSDHPTSTDDLNGEALSGQSGHFVRDVVEDAGFDVETDTWHTYALICHPHGQLHDASKQIAYCRPNVVTALRNRKPRVVVTMGPLALRSLILPHWRSVGEMERWVGWKIPSPDGYWICPTYSPAFALHHKSDLIRKQFAKHIATALAIDSPPSKPRDWKSEVEIIFDDREAARALKSMHRAGGWLAIDYETNCLKPEYPEAEIVSCAVSNGERTISYFWTGAAIEATSRLLRSDRTTKIASNLKMEERWTYKHLGHRVRNWGWDTMLAAHCLDNRPGICGLKFQSFVNLGAASYNDAVGPFLRSTSGWYNRIRQAHPQDLLLYGGMDALLEYDLAMFQRKEMGHED